MRLTYNSHAIIIRQSVNGKERIAGLTGPAVIWVIISDLD